MHAVTYFAPEARTALDELGFRGFWMGYFSARSAPFGVVPTEVVTAAFYNFTPERVAKALPAAWDIASPSDALRARQDSAVAALRRYGVTDDDAGPAAELAEKAARSAPLDGRPLFAANVALDWPDEPVARLWHAVTLLREQRGDGHVAVLSTLGVSGRESNVLHAAAGRVPQDMIMRSRLRRGTMGPLPAAAGPSRAARRRRRTHRRRSRPQAADRGDHRPAGSFGARRAGRRRSRETIPVAHTDHSQSGRCR